MRLPRHTLGRNPDSLREMVETSRREKEARELHARDFDLGELMLQVRSRDTFGKGRVRRCVPARSDEELAGLIDRLLAEASGGLLPPAHAVAAAARRLPHQPGGGGPGPPGGGSAGGTPRPGLRRAWRRRGRRGRASPSAPRRPATTAG